MLFFLTKSTKHLKESLLLHGGQTGDVESSHFADGERYYRLLTDVENQQCSIIASVLPDPESIFELLALYRMLQDNGAQIAAVVIPYLGYARQDRPSRKGEASLGIMVLEVLKAMTVSKLFLLDVHSDLIRHTFNQSIEELSAVPLFAAALNRAAPAVIVAPDAGSLKRAEALATLLQPKPEIAQIQKTRPQPNTAVAEKLDGTVRGKQVLIIDDMIDTGGTLIEAIKMVTDNGAKFIRVAASHGIFSGNARTLLFQMPIHDIMITNSLPQINHPHLECLDIVPIVLKALNR